MGLLKWGQVRLVLPLDLPLLIHHLRGEPTWTMKVKVFIERLLGLKDWGQTFILGISSLGGLLSPVWAPGAAKSLSPDTADHGASFERRSAWPVAAIRGSPLSYTTS